MRMNGFSPQQSTLFGSADIRLPPFVDCAPSYDLFGGPVYPDACHAPFRLGGTLGRSDGDAPGLRLQRGRTTLRPCRREIVTPSVHSMYWQPVTKSVCVTGSLPRTALTNSSSTRQPPRFAGSIDTGFNSVSRRLPAESSMSPPTGWR